MSTTQQFYDKARQAVGGLYVWGAQGHIATNVYLKEKAIKYPAYFDGGRLEMMLKRVAANPKLQAWDCSGLVCWVLEQIGAAKAGFDTTAHGLFTNYCDELTVSELQKGDLLFRYSNGKMVHVGIFAPGACVEAAGGAYGVVECKGLTGANHTAKSYVDGKLHQLPDWTHYGRLKILEAAAPEHVSEPEPASAGEPIFAVCTGTSVNVRSGSGTEHDIVTVAHKGDKFTAVLTPGGWYWITGFVDGKPMTGYMSGKYIEAA